MRAHLKLYAGLSEFLPPGSTDHVAAVEIPPGTTISRLMEQFHVPAERAHLVLLNGIYVRPEDRAGTTLRDGDTIAMWPPVAGG
jgi:molybdopterin converting factor small subunit